MLRPVSAVAWAVLVLAVAPVWTGCAKDSTESATPDDPNVLGATEAGAPTTNDDSGVTDAGDASSPAADASTLACTQGASCQGDQACYRDDGATHHECRCSAGKLACMDIPAAPPSTCVSGGACATQGMTCAVDDGTNATYCTCTANKWACLPVPASSATCETSAVNCQFGPADATTWFDCFSRSGGQSIGSLCTKTSGGSGATGVTFDRVCPAASPTAGTTCDSSVPLGLYCGCQRPNGSSCVCGCRRPGPNMMVSWLCLP